jgi:hypothetical protein
MVTKARNNPHLPPGCPSKDDRVKEIIRMMTDLTFVSRGVTERELVQLWGLSVTQVKMDIADAARIVRMSVTDKDAVAAKVCGNLEWALDKARENEDLKSINALAMTWATISGARAADRTEVIVAHGEIGPDRAAQLVREKFGDHAARVLSVSDDGDDAAPALPDGS